MYKQLFQIFFSSSRNGFYLLGAFLGTSFAIAIILTTFGLMDGFDHDLRVALKKSAGEFTITSEDGFYTTKQMSSIWKKEEEKAMLLAPVIQSRAFLIANEISKGVLLRGVEGKSFYDVTALKVELAPNEVAIGSELAKLVNLSIGSEVVLAFGSDSKDMVLAPRFVTYKVKEILSHGIYEKDLRFVYLERHQLAKVLDLDGELLNMTLGRFLISKETDLLDSELKKLERSVNEHSNGTFRFTPYFEEQHTMLYAVKVEKVMIALVLQVIVFIALFNVVALIFFVEESNGKQQFLIYALGVSKKTMAKFWLLFYFTLWALSSLGALLWISLFKLLIEDLNILHIPGEIYLLGSLSISFSFISFLIVSALTFIWFLISYYPIYKRVKRASIMEGLRKEL